MADRAEGTDRILRTGRFVFMEDSEQREYTEEYARAREMRSEDAQSEDSAAEISGAGRTGTGRSGGCGGSSAGPTGGAGDSRRTNRRTSGVQSRSGASGNGANRAGRADGAGGNDDDRRPGKAGGTGGTRGRGRDGNGNEGAHGAARWRDVLSAGLVVLFYVLFIAFAWYGVYQKSLDFFTGADTGIPGNPEVIPEKLLEPAMRAAIQALIYMALYAFLFANPDKALGHAGERLSRQDLRGKWLPRRRHLWTIPWWTQAVLLFAFSWYLRIQVIDLIGNDTIQVMDFERVFYVSLQDAPVFADVQGINFYRAFPNWALHVKLLHLLNVNFGGEPLTGIMCNAVVSSLSVVLLYLIVYFATDKDVFAVLSALIFSCWPFFLYYMILLTPDFNFVFLCLLGLLVIVVSYRFAKALWLKAALYGLAGMILSLAGFFKSIDKILIIALLIAAILSAISFGRFGARRTFSALLAAAVFFTAWTGTTKLVFRQIEAYVGGNVNTNVAPYFMNVGMNVETYGQWSQDVLDEYLGGIRETDYNFEAVNAEMKEHLEKRVEAVKEKIEQDGRLAAAGAAGAAGTARSGTGVNDNSGGTISGTGTDGNAADDKGAAGSDLPETKWHFFDVKMQKAWANNEGIRFIMQTINPENKLYDMAFYEEYYAQIQAYQVAAALLMALGGLVALIVRERKIVLVCALMVFGFALLLLISEVQPRYKSVVFPFMSVVAAYGIYGVVRPVQLIAAGGIRQLFRMLRPGAVTSGAVGKDAARDTRNAGEADAGSR